MLVRIFRYATTLLLVTTSTVFTQITTFPYSESFDGVITPALPADWSVDGFAISTSTFHSPSNCISTTGNMTVKSITSPIFDFTNRIPEKLVFWERRSATAAAYRFEVRASIDGINYDLLLNRFDTTSSTSSYVQRIVTLAAGLQQQPNVQFRWQLLGDNTNNTGVLRIDDVSVMVAIGFDIGVRQVAVLPMNATRKDSLYLSVIVKNFATLAASNFEIRLFYDENLNDRAELNEQFSALSGISLNPSDSMIFTATYPPLRAGEVHFITIADFIQDENRMNDTMKTTVTIGCVERDLLVNEIMYDPLGSQNEWIELLNRSSYPIDLAGCKFHDKATSSGDNSFTISDTTSIVQPGGFAVVAAESSLCGLFPNLLSPDSNICMRVLNRAGGFSLNNDGDMIVLKDILDQTIDSIYYSSHWHHPDIVDTRGRSLERINPNLDSNDPRNWSTCTNILGGTPGKANSVFTTSITSSARISISPNPFSPDGDGFEDFCMIHYDLPMTTSILNIRIYDIRGRLIRTLANGEIVSTQGEILWNGIEDNKQCARIGVYIIYLEATDQASDRVLTAKTVAVVATRF